MISCHIYPWVHGRGSLRPSVRAARGGDRRRADADRGGRAPYGDDRPQPPRAPGARAPGAASARRPQGFLHGATPGGVAPAPAHATARGFAMASIKDVLASWEAGLGAGLMELVGFEDAVATPGTDRPAARRPTWSAASPRAGLVGYSSVRRRSRRHSASRDRRWPRDGPLRRPERGGPLPPEGEGAGGVAAGGRDRRGRASA